MLANRLWARQLSSLPTALDVERDLTVSRLALAAASFPGGCVLSIDELTRGIRGCQLAVAVFT